MDTDKLAAKMFDDPQDQNSFWGVIFDYSTTKKEIEQKNDLNSTLKNAIVGQIRLTAPKNACNGAWEVKSSSGPGAGKLIYSLGSYMSAKLGGNGLIPDRDNLSQAAINSWKKFQKSNAGHKLDDITNPLNSDPNDDCDVWDSGGEARDKYSRQELDKLPSEEDADAVNRSYVTKNSVDIEGMLGRGKEIYELIQNTYSDRITSNAKLNALFKDYARDFFVRNYFK